MFMDALARKFAVVGIVTIAALLGAACSERSPKPGQGSQVASGSTANPESGSGTPQRFGSDEIELALATMKACAERDNSARSMFECACRSDLALSKEPAPADPAAHCAAYAERTAALAQRAEDEQKRSPLVLGAPDVAPGSFILFAVASPCLADAMKSKTKAKAFTCLCVVQTIANRIARRNDLRLQSDYMVALGEEANAVKTSGQCRLKE
jgi:hypothetical protein